MHPQPGAPERGPDDAPVLLVDVANVVGSRADGWWRDRAGATSRLLAQLAAVPARRRVAVVEGAARKVTDADGVELVRAAGSGDDALVARAATLLEEEGDAVRLVVVTADRGLRARLPAAVRVEGPRWLLDQLP